MTDLHCIRYNLICPSFFLLLISDFEIMHLFVLQIYRRKPAWTTHHTHTYILISCGYSSQKQSVQSADKTNKQDQSHKARIRLYAMKSLASLNFLCLYIRYIYIYRSNFERKGEEKESAEKVRLNENTYFTQQNFCTVYAWQFQEHTKFRHI